MKTKKLFLALTLTCITALHVGAQTPSIPNGNFESWNALTFEIPQNYVWSSNSNAFQDNMTFNVIKTSDAYHGSYAVQMTTYIDNGDTLPGIFVNVSPKDENPENWQGGFAYNQKPIGMRGYYKSSIATPDTGFVMAFFYKSGVMIGQYGHYLYGTHNTYTPFSFSFDPPLAQTPDTVIFGAGSSNFADRSNMRNGSMLMLDSLSFTGVSSQPALFNGDFETWESTTIDIPNDWFLQRDGDNLTGGAYKTSDAKAGGNAIELISYVGERDGNYVTQNARISTGWYEDNCSSNCQEQGGYPFSNQVDTLAFWYKYTPSGSTQGSVFINFKKNGINIDNYGTNLGASASYQYVEIPFTLGQIPDTAIVTFQSSDWEDTLLSFVGSTLIVDEIHFKSQELTTGIFTHLHENDIHVYPVPASKILSIKLPENLGEEIELNIFNTFGQQIFAKKITNNNGISTLDVSEFAEGIYLLRMISDKQTFYNKKIIITR